MVGFLKNNLSFYIILYSSQTVYFNDMRMLTLIERLYIFLISILLYFSETLTTMVVGKAEKEFHFG